MEDRSLLGVLWDYQSEWTDEEIGIFVRRAITEDITEEDLLKDLGLNRRKP